MIDVNQKQSIFDDPELTTPKHDAIMFWLDENIECVIADVVNELSVTHEYFKDSIIDQIEIEKKVWEHPIQSLSRGGNYLIGFVDLYVHISIVCRDGSARGTRRFTLNIYFEVKPKIQSLGEVIRQIRKYESNVGTSSSIFVVVCPDNKFEQKLREQGIGFVKAEIV